MPSELVGTIALWVALAGAIVVSFSDSRSPKKLPGAAPAFLLALALQCLHFAEEFTTGFQRQFPQRLGLEPWSDSFFVVFNAAWLCIWAFAAVAIIAGRPSRLVAVPVWFLAFAAVGNGIAHPVLALSSGGYFPGLVTSPLLGLAGLVLLRAMTRRSPTPT
jgi:hypothetical protein